MVVRFRPLKHGEPAKARIRFRTRGPVTDVAVGIGFSDVEGRRLLTYETDFQDGFRPSLPQPGAYSVEVEVDSLPVSPDVYSLDRLSFWRCPFTGLHPRSRPVGKAGPPTRGRLTLIGRRCVCVSKEVVVGMKIMNNFFRWKEVIGRSPARPGTPLAQICKRCRRGPQCFGFRRPIASGPRAFGVFGSWIWVRLRLSHPPSRSLINSVGPPAGCLVWTDARGGALSPPPMDGRHGKLVDNVQPS